MVLMEQEDRKMMQKTQINKSQINEILLKYSILNIKSFELIKKGEVHSNYVIKTENNQKYILRIYEERNKEEIKLEMDMLTTLSKHNLPVPQPILSKNNTYTIIHNSKKIAVFTFLEGKHIGDRNTNEEQLQELARNLAQIHSTLENFNSKEVKSKKSYDLNWIKQIHTEIKQEHLDFSKQFDKYIEKISSKIYFPENLPKGINHGDLHGDNVFFKENKITGILDFDDCFFGELIIDLGCVIGYWCINQNIDFSRINIFLKEYNSIRKLQTQEIEYLYEGVLLFMLIHFIYWMWNKNNWNKNIHPKKVLDLLIKIGKKDFLEKLEIS